MRVENLGSGETGQSDRRERRAPHGDSLQAYPERSAGAARPRSEHRNFEADHPMMVGALRQRCSDHHGIDPLLINTLIASMTTAFPPTITPRSYLLHVR